MVRIDKSEFQEMFKLGILNKNEKTWTIANRQKSKRKKYYVVEQDYEKYLSVKEEIVK